MVPRVHSAGRGGQEARVVSATKRGGERREQDFYPTPKSAILPLFDRIRWDPPGTFFEPCIGSGAITRHVPKNWQLGWCEITEGTDYLTHDVGYRPDLIITNPPYSLALEFLKKSLGESETVAYLLRLNFLESKKRKAFWTENPPTHLFTLTERPKFINGRSDACGYGWFVWDHARRFTAEPGFHWL